MSSVLHKAITLDDVHIVHSLEYADATAREAAVLITTDVGRIARQLDNATFWVLTAFPGTWSQITDTGAVPSTREILTNGGIQGGGALTGDLNLSLNLADSSLVIDLNEKVAVGVISDAQHGELSGGALHGAASASVAGFLAATDKDWIDKIKPAQSVTVALSGGQYTSIAAALASITDATSTKPYVIEVFPGVYTEAPFAMKSYVAVIGHGSWFDVVLTTNDNLNHFISSAAGAVLKNVAIVGPTGSGYAAVDCQHTGYTPFFLDKVVIKKGYYGVYQHPASYGTTHLHEVVNQYAGSQINKFIYVTYGNITAMMSSFMSGGSAAVVQGFVAVGANASMTLDVCAFRNSGSTDGLYADDGAQVRLMGVPFQGPANAIHIGPNGTGTQIIATACAVLDGSTKDIWVETASANITFFGAAHKDKIDVVVGATASITANDNTSGDPGFTVYGELWLGVDAFPLATFVQANRACGVYAGGGIERVSGLNVKVLAGSGFALVTGTLQQITWVEAATLALPASTNEVWILVDGAGTVYATATPPDIAGGSDILLGTANTGASTVRFLSPAHVDLPQPAPRLYDYLTEVVGPISTTGGAVTKNTSPSLQLDVASGEFYVGNFEKAFTGAAPITFSYWYRDGSGKWTVVAGATAIDAGYYDTGTGTLVAVPGTKYKRDLLFVSVNDTGTEYHVVYGQEVFDSAALALTNPTPPDVLLNESCRLAGVVVLSGASDIATIVDQRPKLGQLASGSTGVSNHGDLAGLSSDDHAQYQLRTEKNAASGYCGLDAASKVASTNLSLAGSAPGNDTIGGGTVGVSTNLARQDHAHNITTATPVAIGSANNDGVATSVPRSDHVHAHGDQTVATLHALATGSAHGFFSSTDFTKLAGIATGATATPLATVAPVAVDAAAAVLGVSTKASKEDHKHSITTATAVALGDANSAGSGTAMALANHVHQRTLRQTASYARASSTTRASSSYAALSGVSVAITTLASGIVLVHFTVSVANSVNNSNVYFQLRVDGSDVASAVASIAAGSGTIASTAITYRATGLTAASHTFDIQWRTTGGGTATINPNTDGQHAVLVVEEVTV